MYNIVSAEINLNFTTEDAANLPETSTLKHEISDIFAAALDKYLSDKGVSYEEVHAVLCDDVCIEAED